jgi:hypothetical protein
MKQLLIVQGDHNDADYLYNITELDTESEHYEAMMIYLKLFVKAINWFNEKNKGTRVRHNWNVSEYCRDPSPADVEAINEYFIPWGEGGIHTVNYIDLYNIDSKVEL